MPGSKHNVERCAVCGLILTGNGLCPTCDAAKIRKSATIPDLRRKKSAIKKSESKKSAKSDVEVDFQSSDDSKNIYLNSPAFLFNKTTKERFELSKTVSKVGRDQVNNISIVTDHHISRYHAWILHNKGKFWVEDLGSTNGTLVNGKPITIRVRLAAGDRITFGKTELIFVVD